MHGLSQGDIQLANALRDLGLHWEMTAASWRDQARADFDKTYLEETRMSVKTAIRAIHEVNRLLSQAIRDCS